MPSVSYSIEMSVDDRLTKYVKEANKHKHNENTILSRTEAISDLLTKAGF